MRHSPTFRALRHRNYRLWFFGQGISLVGTWMQTMAQQVLVYRLTGSAAALGFVSAIGLIPVIPLSIWGGSISDRIPKRTIILAAQWVMLIQAMLLAVLSLTGTVRIWHVYVLAIILAAANSIDLPARQAFTVDMIEGKEDLTNAIGLNSAMFNGARALGPAMAGLMVAMLGEGLAFFANGLSFVAVIISLMMMRDLPKSSRPVQGDSFKHATDGIKFVLRERTIAVIISLVAVSAFLSMPYNNLIPVFAKDILQNSARPVVALLCGENPAETTALAAGKLGRCQSPEALPMGILLTAVGVGAVSGALYIASRSEKTRRGLLLTLGNLIFPLWLLLFAVSRSFVFSTLLMLVTGFSFVLQNALANTLLQLAAPDEMRGRVMGVYTMVFQVTMRLGALLVGTMADAITPQLTIGITAGLSLLYGAAVAVRFPKLRKM